MAEQPGRTKRDGGHDHERRASARLPIEMWVEELLEGSQVFRRAGNLSRGGMYLDQTIPIPLATRVKLRFTLPGDNVPIMVTGEIVSISSAESLGMGVKFVGVEPDAQARIDAYVTRVITPMP
jgi:hypothetical protein